ncbi:DEAD/DEAH box helicase [Weissella tructae]|jgi:ATP-dependent RNA helicase CshB|uniref:DEAD-box ATP-dependent RNA helicase CshB n=2 Tax=Weissella TaxID=46255 RepID=A0A075TYP4_9LACO|nr:MULTISPECIES: DEAD/DEAH box helicase [Weissella]AIG65340.1 DEAD-box ATP-dependent RNA helicase CshB [Weissella tructae]AIM62654.1 DEAD-box ATP-dependent RNA helicase CshB [Weissella ceti]AIM63989.1 DEAD-box ATP-dependent RNA helicase CshB [Weissella ceti]ELA07200.1 ATP-dependent RNA helicase/autoaggregation-mediating protein [Weissella ceti NC36]QVV91721.1 DEAD/DEAH box helicase [Weissella tructae]
MAKFTDYNLRPEIYRGLEAIRFTTPTPVQERFIPVVLQGRSVVGQSQTGSGKTHAFLIPIFEKLDVNAKQVQAIITTPSRELAQQIYDASQKMADAFPEDARPKVGVYVGGTDKARQIQQLQNNQPQIVIGTPGRIKDLYKSGALDIHTAKTLVIDEADMTMDLGFMPEVDAIAGALPENLQMLVFSATIPQKLQPFLKKYLSNPVVDEIPTTTVIAPTIENILLETKGKEKDQVVYDLLTMGDPYMALVFTNTKERAKELSRNLKERGLKVAEIHGGIQPRERRRTMNQIQHLDYQYVVATDLAARGIDIPGVSLIINDGIPNDLEFFVHRVGRTGRNGMDGRAITLYSPDEEDKVAAVEQLGVTFEPMALKKGELTPGFDRRRRKQRSKSSEKLDPTMIGMVKKKKKTVKPGYKRRIKNEIARDAKYKKRIEQRQTDRATRKARKQQG